MLVQTSRKTTLNIVHKYINHHTWQAISIQNQFFPVIIFSQVYHLVYNVYIKFVDNNRNMSTSSRYTGMCRTCGHPNNNHRYEDCWVGARHGRHCQQKIKICCALGGHEAFGITGKDHKNDYVICKPCKHHGRSALDSEFNKYAVIGFINRKKGILVPRRDDTPLSSTQPSSGSGSATPTPGGSNQAARGGVPSTNPLLKKGQPKPQAPLKKPSKSTSHTSHKR